MKDSREQIKKIVRDVYDNHPHWSNYLEFGEIVGRQVAKLVRCDEREKFERLAKNMLCRCHLTTRNFDFDRRRKVVDEIIEELEKEAGGKK